MSNLARVFADSARVPGGTVAAIAAIALAAALALPAVAQAQAAAAQPHGTAAASSALPATEAAATASSRRLWQTEIARVPLPKKGCFAASYPARTWREVPCGPPSKYPNNVGYGNSVMARTSAPIASATGSFDTVTPAALAASGPARGMPSLILPDAFSLQINTDYFDTGVCNGGAAGCKGWQQFIYSRYQCSPACVFVEYWLRGYGATCPAGWQSAGSGGHCYINSPTVPAPGLTAAQLQGATLTASAAAAIGGADSVVLTSAAGNATATATTSPLGAAQAWREVEWNVVGDCCGSRVDFSAGTSIVPRVTLNDGTTMAPTCLVKGFTAESNNLSFGPGQPAATGAGPAMTYTTSSAGGAMPTNCAAAQSIGDTHLSTFGGLFYDFQAAGDFVLAEVDPGFVVHARQVSSAPTWPNASVNHGVGVRLGSTRLAICLAPLRVLVDDKPAQLEDGKALDLPEGDITRRGNVYVVRGKSGDSLRAEVNSSWINVAVGLGRWPAQVRGVLANAGGDVNRIAARDGTVLASPFAFADLYGRFADSWRVAASESLLSACGEAKVERDLPRRPFYPEDLEPKVRERVRGMCAAAGVKQPDLLDACMIDAAVIGEEAARAFVGLPAPAAVARVVAGPADERSTELPARWLPWLLALLAAVALFALFRRRQGG